MFDVLKMYLKTNEGMNCGYVQGMNFIAGAISYHANAEVSFCIFMKLM